MDKLWYKYESPAEPRWSLSVIKAYSPPTRVFGSVQFMYLYIVYGSKNSIVVVTIHSKPVDLNSILVYCVYLSLVGIEKDKYMDCLVEVLKLNKSFYLCQV